LFGIIEEPVEKASATRTNPKRGFDHQVDHREGRCRHDLHHEVAVRDGIERVGRHALEAELRRGRGAVQRVASTGQRPGAKRRDVEAPLRIGQAATVPLQHLDIGEEVVREQHGLGRLDVGGAGQDGVAFALGQVHEGLLQRHDRGVQPPDGPARPEPQVRGDLVVPRPTGVELAAKAPDALGEHRLEVHVDVFEGRIPHGRSRDDVIAQ
jgi:hypothetical protein